MAEPPPPPAGLPGQAPALDPQAGQIPPPSGGPIPAAALQPAPPLPVGPIPAAAAAGLPPAAMLMAVPAPTPKEAGAAAAAAATAALRQHMSAAASMPDASRGSGENTFVAGHVWIQRPRSAHGTNYLARICGSLRAFCPTSDSAEIRARNLGRAVAARDAAVEMWLDWKAAAAAQPLGHVQLTRVYKRDTALRKAYSAYSENAFCQEFGYILGQSLAAAHAGPEDMARHSQLGGGSGGASDFTRDPAQTVGIDLGNLLVDVRSGF